MKSETREEAAARLKALTQSERQGMEEATEGQLQAVVRTDEMIAREEQVNEFGEAQEAAFALLDEPGELAPESEEALDASANRASGRRRSSSKKSRGPGRRSSSRKSQSRGESQPEA
jgi:hypothetical protein